MFVPPRRIMILLERRQGLSGLGSPKTVCGRRVTETGSRTCCDSCGNVDCLCEAVSQYQWILGILWGLQLGMKVSV